MAKIINELVELDVKDKKILSELDMNARIPISLLAKKVKLSEEVVNYRIKNLLKLGVIQYFYPAKDFYKIGYSYVKFLIRMKKKSSKKEKEIVTFLKKNQNIGWLLTGDGKYDLTVGFFVKSLLELQKIYNQMVFAYGDMFLEVEVSIGSRIHHFKHNYLYGTKDYASITLGEVHESKSIDETELKLLNLLNKDGRIPLTELAKKLQLSPNTIKYKLKRLEKDKIILAHRFKLNVNKLGFEHHKVFIYFNIVNERKLTEIITYLTYHPKIIYITQSIGKSILEFEVIIKNRTELHEILEDLKQNFPGAFFDFNTVLHYEEITVN